LPPERVQVIEPVIGRSQTTFYAQADPEPKSYRIGDMQEHRYSNQKAWAPGAWPHDRTVHLENIHEIVANHFDPETGRFKSPLELQAERERREDQELDAKSKVPAFKVDDRMIDDWTGDRHTENWECFGKNRGQGKCPEKESLLMIDQDLALDVDLDLESEYGPVSGEPYDPHLADVERIIKRYDDKDVSEELQAKRMGLPGDPRGGLDKISAALAAHNSESDNRKLKEILESYTTGAKGPDGTPNRERWLEKWNAQLAAKECLGLWATLSDGAVEKFMDQNFESAWSRYDQYGRGNIDELSYLPFIRDFMGSMSDATAPILDAASAKPKVPAGIQVLDVEPIVEPDTPANGAQAPEKDNQNVNNKDNKPTLNENAPSTNPNAAAGKANIETKEDSSAGVDLKNTAAASSAKTEEVSAASNKDTSNGAVAKSGSSGGLEKDPMDSTTAIDPTITKSNSGTGEIKTATVGLKVPEAVTPSDIGD
jgi:hypothetical protein